MTESTHDDATEGPGTASDADRDGDQRTGQDPLPFSQVVGRVVLVLIAVLFIVFAVVNRQPVDFNWVFGQTEVVTQGGEHVGGGVPLIVLLIGSFIMGAIVGAGTLWRRRHVRRARRPEDDRA